MEITSRTKVVGVFADPVEHTLSPPMQNAAFAAMCLPYVYVPWHVKPEFLGEAVAAVRALRLAGVNVTIPHKVAVMGLLDEVTPEARLIGAVNTIENRDGVLVGHNTDAPGFLRSLREEAGASPAERDIMLLGAGGAARAIGVQMLLAGARSLTVANRTAQRAAELTALLAHANAHTKVASVPLDRDSAAFRQALERAQIVINASDAGRYPHHHEPALISRDLFHADQLVCDIVYTPRRTALLCEAEAAGCATLPGLGMLAYQGAISIEIWTGRRAPAQLMKTVLEAALEQRENTQGKER